MQAWSATLFAVLAVFPSATPVPHSHLPIGILCLVSIHAASVLQAQGRQPHEEVRKFYASHYSSNIMKGAVMGPQSLDELEQMVRSKFQAVGNADLRPAEFDGVHCCTVAQTLLLTLWRHCSRTLLIIYRLA